MKKKDIIKLIKETVAEGSHYRKEPANRVYPNRDPRGGMFETK